MEAIATRLEAISTSMSFKLVSNNTNSSEDFEDLPLRQVDKGDQVVYEPSCRILRPRGVGPFRLGADIVTWGSPVRNSNFTGRVWLFTITPELRCK